ncbi:MAG: DUF4493 domain-containing protein [Tannerellaceae bacterium]|nr:DUF4493 domain-containing protein [Tannerellaceae bacterium]
MKNILYTILFLLGCILGFSCKSEQPIEEQETGYVRFDLSVNQQPEVILSRAGTDEVDNFNVIIENDQGIVKSYDSYADLKESGLLELQGGDYIVRAQSTLDDVKDESDEPTYIGETSVYVNPGFVSVAIVECFRREVEMGLNLSALVKQGFTDLKVIISLDNNVLFDAFTIDEETGLTNSHFFAPKNDLQLQISGKYNGLDLGTLGGRLKSLTLLKPIKSKHIQNC